ncbi:MAG: diacylglycerol kinase family lipid kinase [Verrucomicrobia bacterium]|nr:diacylglycerol kinase family lipid kinase [Verrucomicrobiota bacterium]
MSSSPGPTVVIVNPRSQGGAAGRHWPESSKVVRRHFDFEERMTRARGDATRLAREAVLAGARRIVAVGGDGTVNEVINGLLDDSGRPLAEGVTFGLLPCHTGGDFRRLLGVPTELDGAAAVIARGHTRCLDAGRLTCVGPDGASLTRHFVNIGSCGVSAVVAQYVNASSKRTGALAFYFASFRAMLAYRNAAVRLRCDDEPFGPVQKINLIAVANARHFGGGMLVAPNADPADGLFDVITLGDFRFTDLLRSGHRLYNGTHLALKKVSARRARTVEIEPAAGERVALEIEGETPGFLPARFEILPGVLHAVCLA